MFRLIRKNTYRHREERFVMKGLDDLFEGRIDLVREVEVVCVLGRHVSTKDVGYYVEGDKLEEITKEKYEELVKKGIWYDSYFYKKINSKIIGIVLDRYAKDMI